MNETQTTQYTKLATDYGSARNLIGNFSSLWLGRDHFLCVDDRGYSRAVSRFDFADIEALVVRPSSLFFWCNMVGGLIFFPGLALALAGGVTWVTLGIILVLCSGVGLVINIIRGKSCHCAVQTRVQSRPVYAVDRYSVARTVIPRLEAEIRAVQGAMPDRESQIAIQRASEAAAVPAPEPTPAEKPPAPLASVGRLRLHLVVYALFGVLAGLFALTIPIFTVPMLCVLLGAVVTVGGVTILSAALQHRWTVSVRLRVVTWSAAVVMVLGGVAAYIDLMIQAVSRGLIEPGISMENQLADLVFRLIAARAEEGMSPGIAIALGSGAVLCAVLACLGLLAYVTTTPLGARAASTTSSTPTAAASAAAPEDAS